MLNGFYRCKYYAVFDCKKSCKIVKLLIKVCVCTKSGTAMPKSEGISVHLSCLVKLCHYTKVEHAGGSEDPLVEWPTMAAAKAIMADPAKHEAEQLGVQAQIAQVKETWREISGETDDDTKALCTWQQCSSVTCAGTAQQAVPAAFSHMSTLTWLNLRCKFV